MKHSNCKDGGRKEVNCWRSVLPNTPASNCSYHQHTGSIFSTYPQAAAPTKKSSQVYLSQMIVILAVVIAAVINLSRTQDNYKEMWIFLPCSTIGYILPNPKLRRTDNTPTVTNEKWCDNSTLYRFTPPMPSKIWGKCGHG